MLNDYVNNESANKIAAKNDFWKYFLASLKNDVNMPRMSVEVVYDVMLFPEILEDIVNSNINNGNGKIQYVTKEFPVKKSRIKLEAAENNEVKEGNSCISVDYVMHDENTLYFVELKTDMNSIAKYQRENYRALQDTGDIVVALIDDATNFESSNSSYNKKYQHQIKEIKERLQGFKGAALEIIYILPKSKDDNDFKTISLEEYAKSATDSTKGNRSLIATFKEIWRYTQNIQ